MGWFDSKDKKATLGSGAAENARKAIEGRGKSLDDQIEAASGGPSGKDGEAAKGNYRLTTDDKRIK